ncbi:MAG: hypothetical protein Q7U07_06260 [Gammaproteobacteria bacterium]|nr:hypothetical protein [Gammaproteobacteria bacterium]
MNIALVFSGIAGAFLGAIVVVCLNYSDRRHAAKNRLRVLLLKNGYSIWWGSDKKPWQVVEANYVEIHAEYLALRNLIVWGFRRSLDNAWIAYTGVGHYRDIPDYDPSKMFAKSEVTKEKAIDCTIGFLKALE